MEYKPTAKDTATFPLHVEPTFTKTPFSKLLTNPANPQVSGGSPTSSCSKTCPLYTVLCTGVYDRGVLW